MNYSILMIDDRPGNQIRMRDILGKDFHIQFASNIESAVKILADSNIELVLIEHSYLEKCQSFLSGKINQTFKKLPLIIMKKSKSGRVIFTRIQ